MKAILILFKKIYLHKKLSSILHVNKNNQIQKSNLITTRIL